MLLTDELYASPGADVDLIAAENGMVVGLPHHWQGLDLRKDVAVLRGIYRVQCIF